MNLAQNPQQVTPPHAEAYDHLRRLLHHRMAELNDQFMPRTWYRDHWTEDRIIVRTAATDSAADLADSGAG